MSDYKPITVTELFDKIKIEMCENYCKYTKECGEAMEEGENYPCPLDCL